MEKTKVQVPEPTQQLASSRACMTHIMHRHKIPIYINKSLKVHVLWTAKGATGILEATVLGLEGKPPATKPCLVLPWRSQTRTAQRVDGSFQNPSQGGREQGTD